MYKYEFNGQNSYSSHPNADHESIESGNVRLPDTIIYNGHAVDWRESYKWCENVTRSGYRCINDDVRIKYESSASPDYYKDNGCGTCWMTLKIRSNVPLEFEYYE